MGIVAIAGTVKPMILLCTFRARLSKNGRKNDYSVLEKTSRGRFIFKNGRQAPSLPNGGSVQNFGNRSRLHKYLTSMMVQYLNTRIKGSY